MANGYYIYFGTNSDGVNRKIDMQIKEFSKFLDFKKILVSRPKLTLLQKVVRSWPYASLGYNYEDIYKMLETPVCIYIRRTTIDCGLIVFLKKVKENFPKCKIIWEIPTYPYFKDSYCNNVKHFIRMFPLYIKDLLNRVDLKKYVDYISTFSLDDEIIGIPTLKILNGIYVDDIAAISNKNLDDTIDIISVAMMSPHHGYERLITGMAKYYRNGGTRKIIYHCVGYGSEESYYKKLVSENGLADHVRFYGRKNGTELDELYENIDIAVTSLGLYKKDINLGAFLKTGEYLAKGLPIISGSPVDVLDHNEFDYFIEFPNDDSSIDMKKVIDFYDRVYREKREDVIKSIRKYAYKKIDMPMALKNVTDIIGNMIGEK